MHTMHTAIAMPENISHKLLHWHPRFNVYAINQDVLLISGSEQFFLPAEQYLFLSCIDGGKDAYQILLENNSSGSALDAQFHYQILQLKGWGLLLESANAPRAEAAAQGYLRPSFDSDGLDSSIGIKSSASNIHWLSVLPPAVFARIEAILPDAGIEIGQALQIIFVDDFLDPRLRLMPLEQQFLLVKISGDDIWISPLFFSSERILFERLQQRILDNQPARKWLMQQWPGSMHGYPHCYPIKATQIFSTQQKQTLCTLIARQIGASLEKSKQLLIFSLPDNQTSSHAINQELGNDEDFAHQIHTPIQLKSCISHFNQDGGSRCVAAQETVEKLSQLVSPITGIINHFIELPVEHDTPVKIYRTGFYKTPFQARAQFEPNGFVQTCLGKGVSHIQSQASALSEAVERYCALYRPDVQSIKYTLSALKSQDKRTFSFQQVVPCSSQQYQRFSDHSHPDSKRKQAVIPYDDAEIHWLPCHSLSQDETVYLPLTLCFNHTPFNDAAYGRWNSNGCAAGNSLEEAILQGLFELLERDATAIWWYNRIVRQAYDLSRLDQNYLQMLTDTINPKAGLARDFWVLDITADLGIPVMAAIGKNKGEGGLVMGFGCHLIPEMAAQRALTELCQLIAIRNNHAAPFDFDAIEDHPFLYAASEAKTVPYALSSSSDIKQDVLAIVSHLNQFGMETLVLNYSRATIPLCTAKVVVPGLCHIWPQLANPRLYDVAVKLGWLNAPKNEDELNQQALYI
jgi:oxazoline/thiazoline synthase